MRQKQIEYRLRRQVSRFLNLRTVKGRVAIDLSLKSPRVALFVIASFFDGKVHNDGKRLLETVTRFSHDCNCHVGEKLVPPR